MIEPAAEARSILDSTRRIVRALRVYSRKAEERSGLSAAQLFVLQQLEDGQSVHLKTLATRTMTDLSSVSVVVGRLAQKGLLSRRRSARDGRALEIRLSPEGQRRLRNEPDSLQSRLIKGIATLKPAQRKALATGLRQWLDAAGLAQATPMFFEKDLR